MVPLRLIAEAFGAGISWDGLTNTANIQLDGMSLNITIGQLQPGMPVAPMLVNDRTLVPLRFIAESFGANVVWNPENQRINIYR
jgi:hypothetical protein